jgi:hypothetical protein
MKAWPDQNGAARGQSLFPPRRAIAGVGGGRFDQQGNRDHDATQREAIKNYLANMFPKLHISRRAQAATFFVKRQV